MHLSHMKFRHCKARVNSKYSCSLKRLKSPEYLKIALQNVQYSGSGLSSTRGIICQRHSILKSYYRCPILNYCYLPHIRPDTVTP